VPCRFVQRLVVETALRAGDLRSLTTPSFQLDCENPTVTIAADYSKQRRGDTLPLRPALAAELGSFLGTLLPTAKAFSAMSIVFHVARMFWCDIQAAGIPHRDTAGLVADFHSLRHTFVTNLARDGVHPKVAQALARYSTITLTMDRYSHKLIDEQSAALAALPDLSAAAQQERHWHMRREWAACLGVLLVGFGWTSGDSGRLW
jgi:integrase